MSPAGADPYRSAARAYDLFYSEKDYAEEAGAVVALAEQYSPGARSLLDVGCGTGVHLSHLASHYARVVGVDASAEMLGEARAAFPEIPFHQGDMRTFALGDTFDVVTCLFSAVGYMTTVDDLHTAVANMARTSLRGACCSSRAGSTRTSGSWVVRLRTAPSGTPLRWRG